MSFVSKYFGKIEYKVTIVNVDGEIQYHYISTLKNLHDFVAELNTEKYWDIQKIEKYRKYEFKYEKKVVHSPMWFRSKDITEMENMKNHDYSFLLKHKSLKNIQRVLSK